MKKGAVSLKETGQPLKKRNRGSYPGEKEDNFPGFCVMEVQQNRDIAISYLKRFNLGMLSDPLLKKRSFGPVLQDFILIFKNIAGI